MLIRMLALAALAPLLLLAACGGDDDNAATPTPNASDVTNAPGPEGVAITASDFALEPMNFTATIGQTVNIALTNNGKGPGLGGAKHSFTIGTTDIAEADVDATDSGSFVATAETVEFHCKYHPTLMKGTITILS